MELRNNNIFEGHQEERKIRNVLGLEDSLIVFGKERKMEVLQDSVKSRERKMPPNLK